MKAIQGRAVVAGDGRHNSMGHSAKFGAHTIFCCTLQMIIHFALIQVRKIHCLLNIKGTAVIVLPTYTPLF